MVTHRSRLILLGLLLAAVLLPALLVAAQATGQLSGHVVTVGASGEPLRLPGATLTLVPKNEPSPAFAARSDATGAYRFANVPAGAYTLTVSLEGYETQTQDVLIEAGSPLEITVTLTLQVLRQEVTVTGRAEGIQAGQTSPSTELAGSIYENAPLASERFLDALPLVPGVLRGPDGLIKIKGANSTQTGWLVNSANVADPVTGEQAINLPVDVIQEVEVLANPYGAEYGKFAGAVTTIETKPSSDKWSFKLNNFFPRFRRRNGSLRGVEAATPRVTFSGPLVKEKLAILQSFEYRLSRNPVTSLPELERDTDIESFDSFTQLDASFSPTHKLSTVFSLYPQKNRFATLDTFTPQPATANYRQRGWMAGTQHHYIFTDSSLLVSTFSVKDFDADIFPATPGAAFVLRPEGKSGSFFNTQSRTSRRYELLEVYSFAARQARGQHWLKLGFNFARDGFDGTHRSGAVEVRRGDGTLAERIDFVGGTALGRNKSEFTLFFHDKWNLHRRLTFDLGARYDYDSIVKRHNLAPRVAFAYVLTQDARTLLRGGVGLFYDKVPLNVATFEQLQQRVVTRLAADGVTVLDGPRTFVNRLTKIENPRSLAFNLELDREVARGLLIRFGYTQREGRDEYIVEPFDDVGGLPTLELAARGRSRYREFQLTANYRFREGSFLNVSYVHSESAGDLNTFQDFFGNFENPILRPNERSRLSFDVPDRLVAWGDIELLWGAHWAPVLEVRSGFPFSLLDEEQNFVGARNQGGRFPAWATLDSQFLKRFKFKAFGKQRGILVGLKIFNMLDHFNPRDVQQNLAAFNALGFFNARGRLFRGKFAIDF
ncbi:MAG: TonB-dependent receptor [Acidobacteria bacterium]|nr:TonB-dependent receptor [Acidobacteriota bacterium]